MAGAVGNESNHLIDGLTVRGGLALEGNAGQRTFLNRDAASHTARQVAKMRARGYYAETFDQSALSGGGSAAASGTVYFAAIGLLTGDIVTNISTLITSAAGTGITLAKVGLYSSAGTLLASSASDHVAYNAGTGVKTTAMTTPYTVLADDGYYVALINVTGTGATMARNASGVAAPLVGSGTLNACGIQTGQTDLPASATITTGGTTFYLWAAIS